MLTAAECRKLLGDEAKTLTDQQINDLKDWLMRLADIAIAAEPNNVPPLLNAKNQTETS